MWPIVESDKLSFQQIVPQPSFKKKRFFSVMSWRRSRSSSLFKRLATLKRLEHLRFGTSFNQLLGSGISFLKRVSLRESLETAVLNLTFSSYRYSSVLQLKCRRQSNKKAVDQISNSGNYHFTVIGISIENPIDQICRNVLEDFLRNKRIQI